MSGMIRCFRPTLETLDCRATPSSIGRPVHIRPLVFPNHRPPVMISGLTQTAPGLSLSAGLLPGITLPGLTAQSADPHPYSGANLLGLVPNNIGVPPLWTGHI